MCVENLDEKFDISEIRGIMNGMYMQNLGIEKA